MKIYQKRYFYYIVYSIVKGGQKNDPAFNSIELELRQPIQSIAHCEEIVRYIESSLNENRKRPVSAAITWFTLLRTERRFFLR